MGHCGHCRKSRVFTTAFLLQLQGVPVIPLLAYTEAAVRLVVPCAPRKLQSEALGLLLSSNCSCPILWGFSLHTHTSVARQRLKGLLQDPQVLALLASPNVHPCPPEGWS